MLIKKLPVRYAAAGVIAIISSIPFSFANAETVAEFYKGRQVDLVIPFGIGGLTAAFGRTVGARGTYYCYSVASRTGSYICMSTPNS